MYVPFIALLTFACPQVKIETRTLLTGPRQGAGTDTLLFERISTEKSFIQVVKTISHQRDVTFATSEYGFDGMPVRMRQEGFWNGRWNVFETVFAKGGPIQTINDKVTKSKEKPEVFRNPTVLWFWKVHPRKGQSVTVNFLAQNTIATFKIKYTYEGDEKMTLAGRAVTLHKVREDPLSSEGVFTYWWYDDRGMGVKRYHKTTQHEYTDELLAWR